MICEILQHTSIAIINNCQNHSYQNRRFNLHGKNRIFHRPKQAPRLNPSYHVTLFAVCPVLLPIQRHRRPLTRGIYTIITHKARHENASRRHYVSTTGTSRHRFAVSSPLVLSYVLPCTIRYRDIILVRDERGNCP